MCSWKVKSRQLSKDVAVGHLFREKSSEQLWRRVYRENRWWESTMRMAQSSGKYTVALLKVCTLNLGISPKGVCSKSIITFSRPVSEHILSGKCKLWVFIAVHRLYIKIFNVHCLILMKCYDFICLFILNLKLFSIWNI